MNSMTARRWLMADGRRQTIGQSTQRGVALVVVLWIFIFLFVVAFDFAASIREEAMAAHRYSEEADGYYLALAGFEQALYNLLNQPVLTGQPSLPAGPQKQSQELADGSWQETSFGSGSYRVRLVDEAGKISLNRTDEDTLRRIFTNLGVTEPQRSVLVDSILDWRDTDDLVRTNGAEDDYYLSLSPSYTAKNGPFDTVEELLWVRGVTPELFYGTGEGDNRQVGLREIFTVDSPLDRINARTMSAEVCTAILGLPLAKCRNFVEERKKLSENTLADLLKLLGITADETVLGQLVFVNPTTITIEASGRPADSLTQRTVKGVVRVSTGNSGYEIIRWVDRAES